MKKPYIIRLLVVLAVAAVALVVLLPRPLVTDTSHIDHIFYNPDFGVKSSSKQVLVMPTPEQEAQILDCLRQYKVQNSLTRSNGYGMDDVAAEFHIWDGNQCTVLVVGKPHNNYTYQSAGSIRYNVLGGDGLWEDLRNTVDLSALTA